MKIDAISFGSQKQIPVNHEEMQNKALLEIWKHYQATGKYEPAIIDYYENKEPKITYLSDKKSTSLMKKIITRVVKLFRKKV